MLLLTTLIKQILCNIRVPIAMRLSLRLVTLFIKRDRYKRLICVTRRIVSFSTQKVATHAGNVYGTYQLQLPVINWFLQQFPRITRPPVAFGIYSCVKGHSISVTKRRFSLAAGPPLLDWIAGVNTRWFCPVVWMEHHALVAQCCRAHTSGWRHAL